ncbi:DUF2306 domain-containing protein [Paenibacillus piri]|uniref:DUF2306 domain-containing protein n=1 Tax=Paenibacillus piri TaxID=2547395 RepID=A0A4R5KB70_9BACL|nr:DUF2306 domain-containing protein [Paenibacillus piri]TDF92152.1 DUF2306 domain-containing protein [Paenibacillus piri]
MSRTKLPYFFMLVVMTVFIVYVMYTNYIRDPQAVDFLSHKLNLKRPIQLPVWLSVMKVHLAFASLAMVSGAANFSSTVYRNHRTFHKFNGYAYLISVVIVIVSSGYMAPYATGGKPVSIAFNLLNIVWLCLTAAAIVKIKKKQIHHHRKWMVRSYAFCFTNMFIHMLTAAFHEGMGLSYSTSYMAGVYGSIVLLFMLAEVVNRTIYRNPPVLNRIEKE